MKVQIGSGPRPIEGWENIDCRPLDIQGHAADLPYDDNTVDLIFANAVFEHLYLPHHITALTEWARVLTPTGQAVVIGIPDFEVVARAYLDGEQGIVRTTFDLLEVHRYCHGYPEADTDTDWYDWSPSKDPDLAPPGWLPQVHKACIDYPYLSALLQASPLQHQIFRYQYVGEHLPLNLAFIAGHESAELQDTLNQVPDIGEYVQFDTIEPLPPLNQPSPFLELNRYILEDGTRPGTIKQS